MDPTTTPPKPTVKKPHHHHHHLHPQPDPTIQNISHRFSKLYANHKKKSTPPTTTTSLTDESNTHHDNYKRITTTTETKLKKEIIIKAASDEEQEEEEEIKKNKKLIPSSIPPPPPVVNNNNGRRRKSLCSISSLQLADFFSCAGVKVVAVDMPPFMQIHAVDCARKAHDSLEKFTSKTLALTLKKEFDGVYGPAWHCIVGTSFGSFVTHSVGGFMYFSMDHKLYILLFKTTVQRAPQES